jgi:hypothetical protein
MHRPLPSRLRTAEDCDEAKGRHERAARGARSSERTDANAAPAAPDPAANTVDEVIRTRWRPNLVLAGASPDRFRPIAQAQILPATVRAHPALADGFLFARNSDTRSNELVCLDLRP